MSRKQIQILSAMIFVATFIIIAGVAALGDCSPGKMGFYVLLVVLGATGGFAFLSSFVSEKPVAGVIGGGVGLLLLLLGGQAHAFDNLTVLASCPAPATEKWNICKEGEKDQQGTPPDRPFGKQVRAIWRLPKYRGVVWGTDPLSHEEIIATRNDQNEIDILIVGSSNSSNDRTFGRAKLKDTNGEDTGTIAYTGPSDAYKSRASLTYFDASVKTDVCPTKSVAPKE